MSLQQDPKAAVEFLTFMYPEGPWVLTALRVERSDDKRHDAPTATFYPGDDVAGWMEQFEGGEYNLYFSVNKPKTPCTKKASRLEIEEMCFLHVDVDPRTPSPDDDKAKHTASERERILALFKTNLPEGVPEPSAVIDSGGGFWGLWRLEEPFSIDKSEDRYDEAKLYNLRLEVLFGADSCHNVDRIARLPGSVNWPNAKKQRKGRVAALAEVVYTDENIYGLTDFTKAPRVHVPLANVKPVEIDVARVTQVESLDELPSGFPARARVMIAQGHDPDDLSAGKFDTEGRSGPVFYVCCELVRQGCTDEMIYSLITDPGWGISESVIDGNNGNPDNYARRQIGRAREMAVDPMLARMNDRFAVVGSYGGKCRVLSWESQPMPEGESRDILTFQSFTDFRNRYSNQFIEIPTGNGVRNVPLGKWWLESPARRTYAGIVFDPTRDGDVFKPGHDGDPEYLDHNLWRGFGVKPVMGSTPLFHELVDNVIAGGDTVVSKYLWKWLAWTVQNPDRPAEVAIVLRGGQGTGKGTFARTFGRLFGQHYMHVSDSRAIAGKFNAHLRDCVYLFADEAFVANQKDIIGTLKRTITEPTLFIEGKGENAVQWTNRLHIIMASNESWVVPAEIDERRFVVLDVMGSRTGDDAWWASLNTEIATGGLEALLAELLSTPLDNWHPRRDRPVTAALIDQKRQGLRGVEAVWFEALFTGQLSIGTVLKDGSMRIETADFEHYAEERARAPVSSHAIGALFGQPPKHHRTRAPGMDFQKVDERPRGWLIPPLQEARQKWEKHRWPVDWDDAGDGWYDVATRTPY